MDEMREILDAVSHGKQIMHHETERVRKDGARIHISLTISPISDEAGTIFGASAISRDITERKQTDERLRFLAQHDALTGLPNRMLCYDRIGQAILRARRDREQVGILFLDLDGFKPINDSLGHEIGDELLRTVARRLQQCLREGDTVARLGGDEFVICLPALRDSTAAATIADKVLESLCAPVVIGESQLQVTCSIGISLYPRDGTDTQMLLRAADIAMYQAKSAGRNRYRQAQ
jgi:diguanylate cyclase (GGDEF)-like protein